MKPSIRLVNKLYRSRSWKFFLLLLSSFVFSSWLPQIFLFHVYVRHYGRVSAQLSRVCYIESWGAVCMCMWGRGYSDDLIIFSYYLWCDDYCWPLIDRNIKNHWKWQLFKILTLVLLKISSFIPYCFNNNDLKFGFIY